MDCFWFAHQNNCLIMLMQVWSQMLDFDLAMWGYFVVQLFYTKIVGFFCALIGKFFCWKVDRYKKYM